ncbi:MAG: hypothetical protein SGARI_006452 [Bacillariaceae sp.]
MNGMVFFASPITDELRNKVIQQIVYKSMATDSQGYVETLRANGMEHVANATLLSMQGNEMQYNQDNGEMVEMNSDNGSDSDDLEATNATTTTVTTISSRDMGDDMKNKVLLLCLILPVIVIVLAAAVFALRFAREGVNWSGGGFGFASSARSGRRRRQQDNNDDDDAALCWQCSEVRHQKRRKSSSSSLSWPREENLSDISFHTTTPSEV